MSRSARTLIRRSATVLPGATPHIEDRGVALRKQRVDLALEVLEVVEALVDAREPDVCDVVELAQLLHREGADQRRRDLGRALRPKLRLDLVGRPLGGIVGDRSAGQRLAQARGELLAVELLPSAIALDDDEPGGLDPFVGREPRRTGRALPAAADRRGIVEVARVDDPGLAGSAMGTAHRDS